MKHKILGYVFLGLIFAAIVSVAYYEQVKNQPIPGQVVHQDPTAGWKTYANNQYGFEFKYPTILTYTAEANLGVPTEIVFSNGFYFTITDLNEVITGEKECNKNGGGECFVSPSSQDFTHDLNLFNSNQVGLIPCNYQSYGQGIDWRSQYSCELVRVGLNKFLMLYENGGAPYGIPTKDYIFYKDGKRYDFLLRFSQEIGSQTRAEFEQVEKNNGWTAQFNQILSTFQFSQTGPVTTVTGLGGVASSGGAVSSDGSSPLSKYPDYSLTSVPTSAVSVKYIVEHRSALDGKQVKAHAIVVGSQAGWCPPAGSGIMMPCSVAQIILADSSSSTRDQNLDLRISVDDASGYKVGSIVDIFIQVSGSKDDVIGSKI